MHRVGEAALLADLVEQARAHRAAEQRRIDGEGGALPGVLDLDLGPVGHPQVGLVGVAFAHQGSRVGGWRRLVRVGFRSLRKAGEQLLNRPILGQPLEVADQERAAALRRPAPVAERDDALTRERVADVLGGSQHGTAERVIAKGRLVDQVLGHHRRLIVGPRDLLYDHAALAVELVAVDPGAAHEVGQQIGRFQGLVRAHGDVERDQIVARVGVQDRADPLRCLVDVPVRRDISRRP